MSEMGPLERLIPEQSRPRFQRDEFAHRDEQQDAQYDGLNHNSE